MPLSLERHNKKTRAANDLAGARLRCPLLSSSTLVFIRTNNRDSFVLSHSSFDNNQTMTSSLDSIKLDSEGAHYRVGSKLGKDHRQVYKVVQIQKSNDPEWAVKLTKHPKRNTKTKCNKDETGARHLFYKRDLYQGTLKDLQGKVIPKTPSDNRTKLLTCGENKKVM